MLKKTYKIFEIIDTFWKQNSVWILSITSFVYIFKILFVSVHDVVFHIDNVYEDIFFFIANIIFIFLIIILMVLVINNLFSEEQKTIKILLSFISILFIFSKVHIVNFIWEMNQQVFSIYFFVLCILYLVVKVSVNRNRLLYMSLLLFSMITLFLLKEIFTHNITTVVIQKSEFIKYFLLHLGGMFYYISGKECLSLSVFAGFFLTGTLVYLTYIIIINKNLNKYYLLIWGFLLFNMLLVLININDNFIHEVHYIFKHEYITVSLISWNLIFIFYIHIFQNNLKLLYKLYLLGITFSVFLLVYQFSIYTPNSKKYFYQEVTLLSLEMGIDDSTYIKTILHDIEINDIPYADINFTLLQEYQDLLIKENLSPKEYEIIKNIESKIGTKIKKIPKKSFYGDVDKVVRIDNKQKALRLHGWVYDSSEKYVPESLYVVNTEKVIVGYVLTGYNRKDITDTFGEKSLRSGYIGYMFNIDKRNNFMLIDSNSQKVLKIKIK